MGRVAIVLSSSRVVDQGGHGVDVKCDPGGGPNVTAPHFTNPGVDAQPLPGDSAALEDSSGTGAEHATGFADTKSAGRAGPGELRIYARDQSGEVTGELWLQGDGTIVATNSSGGALTLSSDGVVSVSGDSDAPALASVMDAIFRKLAVGVPAAVPATNPASTMALVNLILNAIQSTYGALVVSSASEKLKVGG